KETYTLVSIPPRLIPEHASFENYVYIVRELPFPRWFVNSAVVAVLVTLGTVFVDALAAYAFARKEFFGRDVLFTLLLATVMIPYALLLIPAFLIWHQLRRPDRPGGRRRGRGLPAAPVHADAAGRARARRAHRRLLGVRRLLADHPAALDASPRHAGDLRLHRPVERPDLAAGDREQ